MMVMLTMLVLMMLQSMVHDGGTMECRDAALIMKMVMVTMMLLRLTTLVMKMLVI